MSTRARTYLDDLIDTARQQKAERAAAERQRQQAEQERRRQETITAFDALLRHRFGDDLIDLLNVTYTAQVQWAVAWFELAGTRFCLTGGRMAGGSDTVYGSQWHFGTSPNDTHMGFVEIPASASPEEARDVFLLALGRLREYTTQDLPF